MRPAEVAEVVTLATPAAASVFVLARTGRVAGAVCSDKKLRIWSLPEGRTLHAIELGNRAIDIMKISEDGRWIAAGDYAGSYTVWDTADGAVQWQWKSPYYPFALAFSPDGRRLAVAAVNQPVQIYDTGSHKRLLELQSPIGGTASLAFSRDGARIVTGDADTAVRVYDAGSGQMLARNADFLLIPLAATFTADGKHVLTGGGDQTLALLDAASGKTLRKSEKLPDPVAYLETSPDGTMVAMMLMHADNLLMPGMVAVSEIATGRRVQEWMPPSPAIGRAWTSDGALLAATATEKALHVWRVR
jgi:WD40 repeat protein